MKIFGKFILISIVVTTLLVFIFLGISTSLLKSELEAETESEFDFIMNRLSLSLINPLYNLNTDSLEKIIDTEMLSHYVLCLELSEAGDMVLPGKIKTLDSGEDLEILDLESPEHQKILSESYVVREQELYEGSFFLGSVKVYFTDEPMREQIISRIKDQLIQALIIQIAFIIISFITLTLVIIKPIYQLNSSIVDIARGEGDLTGHIPIQTKDELGTLAGEFNFFINTLNKIIARIKILSGKTVNVKDVMVSNSEETASALYQITKNINSINHLIVSLNSHIQTNGQILESLDQSLQEETEDIDAQSAAVSEVSAAVIEMVSSLNNIANVTRVKKETTDQLVLTAQKGSQNLDKTVNYITEINNSVDSIKEMVNIINKISSQTNLLAMNAAIEAAHAGESGKGFSVVADEIRKLAESSSMNAKEIKSNLTLVLDNIENVSAMGKETSSSFIEINREVQEVSKAFQEISATTQELHNNSKEITNSMNVLGDKTGKVLEKSEFMKVNADTLGKNFSDVNTISLQVTDSISEISIGIQEISDSMTDVQNASEQLSQTIVEQNIEIDRFKTEV